MGGITAYFDLDGTLLDASSEKTLAGTLAKRRPWRIPLGALMWTLGFAGNLLRGRAIYDAARNRGHFSLSNWSILKQLSKELVDSTLSKQIPIEALERLEWHREQGHRLVLISATLMPLAQAMSDYLGMDAVYGSGPKNMKGILTGSEIGWEVPRRKGKVPIVKADANLQGHNLADCWGYGNSHADSFFMAITGNPVAINPTKSLAKVAKANNWLIMSWKM
ncbi:MAG: HAD-IB family phosphatase [Candidatus Poseidoniaceae archaeon]|jgi:HAD superfamily phosphoserine phosphatase-like hydrolase|nr:HAD-IB family phosphatase [Candidatus Poseidoniaceae archaeon]